MRVGIMQPYFFPYLGHFALIANCDRWVVFDITQYTPKTWMNRNRVLHPSGGPTYATVPLANSSQSILTREARILDPGKAHQSIRGVLSHYRRPAPYFTEVLALLDRTFDELDGDSLVALNAAGLRAVCGYLGLRFDYAICSEMDLELPPPSGPGGWAPAIAAAMGADAYLNPVSGRDLFDPADFSARSIELGFLEMPLFTYDTGPYAFQPHLSVLDVLMWNSPDAVRDALATARILDVTEAATR